MTPSSGNLFPEFASGESVLLISPDPDDSRYLHDVFSDSGDELTSICGCGPARSVLRNSRFGAVITERDLGDGTWLDVLSAAQSLPYPPPVIVASRLADERLWTDVLNRGGFDVLAKPFSRDEVFRVIGHALNVWSRSIPKRPARVEPGTPAARAPRQVRYG